jgi:hypothetical protein
VFNHIKSGGKAKKPITQTAMPAVGGNAGRPAVRATSTVGNVKPGTWSAALPKTSLDAAPAQTPLARATTAPGGPPPGAMQSHAPQAAKAPINKADGPKPVKITSDLVLDEFKNLAVMQSQFEERLTALEHEISRLGRENQEIRELLIRQSQ